MSTQIARRDNIPAPALTMPEKMQYAQALADASLLPRAYQRQPGNVLLAMEMGEALGIPAIQAINDIHVIDGKPSASANLIGALVRKAGHKLRVTGDDTTATAQIIRADDPDFTFEVTWTLDRARQAGLNRKGGNWEKYPAAMLKARAITEVARTACSDALYGVTYTPEELGAVVTEDGDPVGQPAPAPSRPAPAQRPTLHEAVQAANRQANTGGITEAQWNQITAALTEAGYEGPAQPQAVSDLLGRRVTSPAQLTAEDADRILTELSTIPEDTTTEAEVVDTDDAA